ncbi:DUF3667 domain-containing protein [Rubrivirga sp. IMCC45206]|uniref:DUF3667 domain-containing protein n=1 Tax=Rubrivirga sp. IMCC45206 TaxID=3391614 RepID=UPI00398F9FF5
MSEVLPVDARACLNCEARLAGPYCAACGQRDEPPDLPLRRVLAGFAGDVFSFDGRVLQTLGVLLRRPGELSRDWAAGRRARHVAPFRLYLLCSLVFVGASASYELAKTVMDPPSAETAEEDAAERREMLRGTVPPAKVDRVADYLDGMMALGSRWFFLLMPLGGFGLYVLYHFRRPAYTAHFVLAIHVFCVVVLLLAARRLAQLVALVSIGDTLGHSFGAANWAVLGACFVASYVYAALAIRRFYGVGTLKALASAPAVTIGPVVAWMVIFATGMLVVVALPT